MKSWTLVVAICSSIPMASAHFETGTYRGTDDAQAPCEFQVAAITHEGGVKNPLAERVVVTYQGQQYTLSHLPVVNFADSSVLPDHGRLTGVAPFQGGAMSVVVTMDHSNGQDGPSVMEWLRHDWKNEANNSKLHCQGLKHQE